MANSKGLAAAAAVTAVGKNNSRKRTALQTLTNINRQPRQLDAKNVLVEKVSIYNDSKEKPGRQTSAGNAISRNASMARNGRVSLQQQQQQHQQQQHQKELVDHDGYPNSDDTVEEEDEEDEEEDDDYEVHNQYYRRTDAMEDIDTVEELDIADHVHRGTKRPDTRMASGRGSVEYEQDYDTVEDHQSAVAAVTGGGGGAGNRTRVHGMHKPSFDEFDDIEVEVDDDEDDDEDTSNNNVLLHDLTEPTALAVMNIVNDSVLNPNALFPVWEQADKEELRQAYYEIRSRPGILDEDDEDTYDISMVAEYGDDIFAYMRQLEVKMRPSPGYMDLQTEIQWSMRSVLVDWLVQVHHRFNLLPETLFLTINYMDRFLSIKVVSLSKFQLVGIVALFLAAKYEEINCPSVQEIVYMVENGFSADEILKAERYMIDLLDFNLGWPGPMSFLRRTSKADDYDLETRTLAKYLLEISVMDERFVGALPSWIAATAHYLARLMLNRGEWTSAHVYFSGYTAVQLNPAVEVLLECCEHPLEHHKAIYEKYSDRKFKRASLFVADYMRRRRAAANSHTDSVSTTSSSSSVSTATTATSATTATNATTN
ncbi:B-type cyclin CLB4 [Sugiyamaella lignohabitans]|uniref:B-type cyclin CLB4 n=1 Tax=Sugiyamaella lignohabitans TaxID=796027 RepID=A0A167DHE1_9ASCO|nr:B-type cyclin CLB4 [Sugiyamaella lignohabitans]ANB12923.1 B-type cyclin CLB4 [Sugiyamaella lignohabitans]